MNMERFLQVITFITTFIKKNKKLYINMLDTGNSIGEILFLFKKKKKKDRSTKKTFCCEWIRYRWIVTT